VVRPPARPAARGRPPHQDGTWPHSREEAAQQFGHLEQDKINKIARSNAIKLFGLSLPES
jgi:hypothetical protein